MTVLPPGTYTCLRCGRVGDPRVIPNGKCDVLPSDDPTELKMTFECELVCTGCLWKEFRRDYVVITGMVKLEENDE